MPVTLVVPKEYGYVLITAVASILVNQWHGSFIVGGARKAAKVPYPNCYASANEAATSPEKYRFNCAQRAHANYMESLPQFLVCLFIGGLEYPISSVILGVTYLVGRIAYCLGYVNSSKPSGAGRYYGSFQYIGLVGVLYTSCATIYSSFFA